MTEIRIDPNGGDLWAKVEVEHQLEYTISWVVANIEKNPPGGIIDQKTGSISSCIALSKAEEGAEKSVGRRVKLSGGLLRWDRNNDPGYKITLSIVQGDSCEQGEVLGSVSDEKDKLGANTGTFLLMIKLL